jgi:hypothetical protein
VKAWLVIALGLALGGCSEPSRPRGLVEQAEFGVFFATQVQERDEIPFCLDRAKQRQGIRIDFHRPLERPVIVSWELDMPGTTRRVLDARGRRGGGRLVKTGQTEARTGQERVEIELPFSPGDPLGTWNVKVLVAGEIAIDRPFLVYDAEARRSAKRQHEKAEREARRRK